jgi:hypothetical protein
VISKRRAGGIGGEAPASAEVTGAVSPAVEGAASPTQDAHDAPEVTADAAGVTEAGDRATAAKQPD